VHEDHAMLIRWELDKGAVAMQTPNPTPQGVTYINTTVLPTAGIGGAAAPTPTGNSGVNGGGSGKGGSGGGSGKGGNGGGSGKGGAVLSANGGDDSGSGSGRGGSGGSGKGGSSSGRGKGGR